MRYAAVHSQFTAILVKGLFLDSLIMYIIIIISITVFWLNCDTSFSITILLNYLRIRNSANITSALGIEYVPPSARNETCHGHRWSYRSIRQQYCIACHFPHPLCDVKYCSWLPLLVVSPSLCPVRLPLERPVVFPSLVSHSTKYKKGMFFRTEGSV